MINEDLNNNLKKRDLDYQKARMVEYFMQNNMYSYQIKEADFDYYDKPLEVRQKFLSAENIDSVCKSMILENTAFEPEYESEYYQRYYLCIVQYTKEFFADKIARFLKNRQNENEKNFLINISISELLKLMKPIF